MPSAHSRDTLMLDPSTLLSEEGPELIAANLEMGVEVLISRHFGAWLEGAFDLDPRELLAPEDAELVGQRLERLREMDALARLRRFGSVDARLNRPSATVLDGLIDGDSVANLIWADEWAYLQSNSLLGSKARHPLDAFRDAGAAIVEFGKRAGLNLIADVIPRDHIPASIDRGLIGRAALKWIVVGGVAAGGGTLAGIAGATLGGPIGGLAGGKAGIYVGGRVSRAAVLAIDP